MFFSMDSTHDDYIITENNRHKSMSKQEMQDQVEGSIEKKRKRKRYYRLRKHSPQYYQEKRIIRIHKKKEQQWDNRFVFHSIPHLPSNTRKNSFSKLKNNHILKRNRTLNLKTHKDAHQVYFSKTKKQVKKQGQKQNNCFKIRIIKKKCKEEKSKGQFQRQNYLQTLKNLYQKDHFVECHYNILKQVIELLQNKKVKHFISQEIQKLKIRSSLCYKIQEIIKKRENMIKALNQKYNKKNESVQQQGKQEKQGIIKQIEAYRELTVRLIQQILKWRSELEDMYYSSTKKKKKIRFIWKNQDYLIHLGNELNILNPKFESNIFLLGHTNQQIGKDLMVKIRACQTLILEEKLNLQK